MWKKIGKYLLLSIVLLIPAILNSQDITVEASVSSTEVEVGEQFTYSVTVSGSVANIPKPQLPALPDFRVYSAGTSSSFQFINGTISSSVTYNYALVPLKQGTFTIGSAKIKFHGKVYQTQPITVKVVPQGKKPRPKRQKAAPTLEEQLFRQRNQSEIFVRALVNKTKVYVNEPVIFKYKLYYKNAAISQYGIKEMPSFTGFWVEEIPPPKRKKRKVEIYNNSRYYTIVLETRVLFPTSPGTHTIGKTSFQFLIEDIFSFFGRRISRDTNPVTIKVLPLPEKGKPTDFKGTVGEFKISTSISAKKIKQNQPFVLKVIISGSGNIKTISEPVMPELKDFKLYDSRSSINIRKGPYGIKGSKIFEYILIPTSAGELIIDSFKFSFFSSKKKKYVTLKTSPIRITAKPGPATSLPAVSAPGSTPVQLIGKDIRFIKELSKIENQGAYLYKASGIWLLIILPFLTFAAVYIYSRYKFKMETDIKFARASRAYKLAKKRIAIIEKRLKSNDLKDIAAEFEKLLTGYIGDKLNVPSASLVIDEIKKTLKKSNIPQDVINGIVEIYDIANMLRYAPSKADKTEYEELLSKTVEVINKFETLNV